MLAVLIFSVSVANADLFTDLQHLVAKLPDATLSQSKPVAMQHSGIGHQSRNTVNGTKEAREEGQVGNMPATLPLMASALCMFGIARRRNINR